MYWTSHKWDGTNEVSGGVYKRPLSACHTRCKCSMETFHNSVKVEFGNKRSRIGYYKRLIGRGYIVDIHGQA